MSLYSPARSAIRAKRAVVNGVPHSDVNSNGDLGSCSRLTLRRARNSSPWIGCVLCVPFLTPQKCSAAAENSISQDVGIIAARLLSLESAEGSSS